MAVVIGIDLGSSGARAIAIAPDGIVAAWNHEQFAVDGSGSVGRANSGVWLKGLENAISSVRIAGEEIAAIGIGGQSPTTVPMSGEPAVTCRHPIGLGLDLAESQAAQYKFLETEIGQQIIPAQIWDWALRHLGAKDIQGLWPGDKIMPGFGEPVQVGTVCGYADGSLGVPIGTPLVSGSNDAFMSFWAGGLGVPGRAHDPGGRTGGVGIAIDAKNRSPKLVGFPSIVAGVDIVGGPVNGHGELLEWWSSVTSLSILEIISRATDVPPGSKGVVVLPYLSGERAPRWLPSLRGEILGLSLNSGAAEISRAVLESAAYGLRHIYEELKPFGVSIDLMCCAGSPARSPLWNLIKASVLEVPVEVPQEPDQLSAYGCALAAGAAIEWWSGPQADNMESWPVLPMKRVEPEPHSAYQEGYQRFVEAGNQATTRLQDN